MFFRGMPLLPPRARGGIVIGLFEEQQEGWNGDSEREQ